MELNIKLLQRVKRAVLEEPRRIRMDSWFTPLHSLKRRAIPPCKTVGCIAGWACALSTKKRGDKFYRLGYDIGDVGAEALGFANAYTVNMFFIKDWPQYFQNKIEGLKPGTMRYAKVVAEVIDYYILKYQMDKAEEEAA